MPSGGKRKGAGRPKGTKRVTEPRKAVLVPISLVPKVLAMREKWSEEKRKEEK